MKPDPLDPQRDALYQAEADVFGGEEDRRSEDMLTLPECRRLVAEWQSRDWFQSNHPTFLRPIPVRSGKGSRYSRCGADGRHVQLKPVSRVIDVLVHEVTHVVMPRGVEDHGALFAGMLLYTYGKVLGKKTERRLKLAFKRRGVQWDRRTARHGRVEMP